MRIGFIGLGNMGGPPYIAWEKDVGSPPTSIIAADNKLFVVSADGALKCFGQSSGAPRTPLASEPASAALPGLHTSPDRAGAESTAR